MYTIFLITISLIFLVKINLASLMCDSVEYIMDSEENTPRQYAVGVCANQGGMSNKLQCSPDGSDIYQLEYFGSNCQGTPFRSGPLLSFLTDLYNFNISNFTVNCCTGYQCKYAKGITQEVDSCNNTDDIIQYTLSDQIAIIDLCIAPSYPSWPSDTTNRRFTCQNDSLIRHDYDASKNCDTNPKDFSYFSDYLLNDCKEDEKRTILCDQVAEKQCTGNNIPIPKLTSDGIISNISGIIEAIPVDVCWVGEYGDVQKLECSANGTDVYFFSYDNDDIKCESNPIYNFSVIEAWNKHDVNVMDYTIICGATQVTTEYPSQITTEYDQDDSSYVLNNAMVNAVMMVYLIFIL